MFQKENGQPWAQFVPEWGFLAVGYSQSAGIFLSLQGGINVPPPSLPPKYVLPWSVRNLSWTRIKSPTLPHTGNDFGDVIFFSTTYLNILIS